MSRVIVIIACAGVVSCSDQPCDGVVCAGDLPASFADVAADVSDNGFDAYGCDPATAFRGAEAVYRVSLEEEGFLSAAIPGDGAGAAQVVLLGSLDPEDCIDAHASAVGALLPAGEYFIAVEPAENAGETPVAIRMALTTVATLEAAGIASELAADALTVYGNAWAWGASRRTEYVIVDFTLHSAEPREWVTDMASNELLWNLRVAHGRKSTDGIDLAYARTFSNVPGSNQSSLGLMRSAGAYVGVFGPSFRIEGLEPDFNHNVCSRSIVMHPWAPMGDEYVNRCGWARPSLGCPAIDSLVSPPVRDRLARPDDVSLDQGVLMLFWYPGTDWHASSQYLRGAQPTSELLDQLGVMCDASQDTTPTPPESTDYACD